MNSEKALLENIEQTSSPHKNSTDGQGQPLSSAPKSSKPSLNGTKDTPLTLSPLFEIYKGVKENVLKRGKAPEYEIGLTKLDKALWGLHKKQLLAVGARTSHGKTSFALHLAKSLVDVKKTKVVYFSLEMSKEQLLERLICNVCGINNLQLREGRATEKFTDQENLFTDWMDGVNLLIDDTHGYDFNKLIQVCKIAKPDFIIVDYIQMISTRGFRTKLDAIEEYVRMIKQLSVEMNFGAIIVSQMNRAGGDDPGIQNFKGASTIEEHSDTCILLSWEQPEFTVRVVKQRHGGVDDKDIKLNFKPEFANFTDAENTKVYPEYNRK